MQEESLFDFCRTIYWANERYDDNMWLGSVNHMRVAKAGGLFFGGATRSGRSAHTHAAVSVVNSHPLSPVYYKLRSRLDWTPPLRRTALRWCFVTASMFYFVFVWLMYQ